MKFKPLHITRFLLGAAIMLCLFSCNTTSRFATTFGKRHYTKGYFWNKAGSGEVVRTERERRKSAASIEIATTSSGRNKGGEIFLATKRPFTSIKPVLEKGTSLVKPQSHKKLYESLKNIGLLNEAGNDTAYEKKNKVSVGGIIFCCLAILLLILAAAKTLLEPFEIIGGIVLLLLGVALLLDKPRNNEYSDENTSAISADNKPVLDKATGEKQTNYGEIGLYLIIFLPLALLVCGFIALLVALGSAANNALIATIIILIPVAMLIAGLILCLVSLSHKNEKHPKAGKIGLCFIGVILLLLIGIFISSLH